MTSHLLLSYRVPVRLLYVRGRLFTTWRLVFRCRRFGFRVFDLSVTVFSVLHFSLSSRSTWVARVLTSTTFLTLKASSSSSSICSSFSLSLFHRSWSSWGFVTGSFFLSARFLVGSSLVGFALSSFLSSSPDHLHSCLTEVPLLPLGCFPLLRCVSPFLLAFYFLTSFRRFISSFLIDGLM